jgi:hypothetical protein
MEELNEKLEELRVLAEQVDDKATLLIVTALQGAKDDGDSILLARHVYKIVKNVLIPKSEMNQRGISLN